MNRFCLEVSGDFACFTRPEMKVERVSYDVITPSAVRAIFEAILWKPAIRWQPEKIEVLSPIRWVNIRRNEVSSKIPSGSVKSAMNKGTGNLGLYIEDERQQRAGLFLSDVKYRLTASFEMTSKAEATDNLNKFSEMFKRRAEKGQCFNQPYLGCREFSCEFTLVDSQKQPANLDFLDQNMTSDRRDLGFDAVRDLGWMLYDMDYRDTSNPMPRFFKAEIDKGIVHIPHWQSEEIRG
jgi:CRISPR-associated protein Cas5d